MVEILVAMAVGGMLLSGLVTAIELTALEESLPSIGYSALDFWLVLKEGPAGVQPLNDIN